MLHVKENFKNMYKKRTNGLKCDSCLTQVETQAQVLVCPAYDKLREGLQLNNQDDLVKYYREVLMLRDKKGTKKLTDRCQCTASLLSSRRYAGVGRVTVICSCQAG